MRQPLWPTSPSPVSDKTSPESAWKPFESPEKMALMPPKLRKAANALAVAVDELTALLSLYEIAITLSNGAFLKALEALPCRAAVDNCRVSVFASIIVGIVAMFDEDQKSVNLNRIAKVILLPSEREAILDFHAQTSAEAKDDAARMLEKLKFLRRRMRAGRFPEAFRNLSQVRHQRFAHFDFVRGQGVVLLQLHDLRFCLVNAARLADLACRVLVQRAYDLPRMRELARRDARELRAVIFTGAAERAPKADP